VGSTKQNELRFLDGKGDIAFAEALRLHKTGTVSVKEKKKSKKEKIHKTQTAVEENIAKQVNNEEDNQSNIDGPIEVALGLDISTSTVGVCLLECGTGKLLLLTHKKLAKYNDEYERGDNFSFAELGIDSKKYCVTKIYVEEAAKKFTPGFSSANTIMTLGRFNGIISYMAYKAFGIKPVMVNVRSARSKLGIKIDYKDKSQNTKQKVMAQVIRINPDDHWWDVKINPDNGEKKYSKACEDRADAYVICKGGILLGL
jgi:hypothetical protein